MIEVKNLVKQYGDHFAVNDLSFTMESGKIYGLLGPNGAGKSTTMNMITGYISATSGDVIVNGHSIVEEPEKAKKNIGYLPEIPPLYIDMTVGEYLITVAELKKIPKKDIRQMLSDIMDVVKIKDMEHRLIKNLSKGYRQRVGIAQALIGYPEIVILDEPTVGLDPKQIIEIRNLIKGLSEKHTVILSSHILSEVSAVCDYVMIIAKGKLIASDTPDRLSDLFKGASGMEMLVKAPKKQIEETISDIPEISSYEIKESRKEEGCFELMIESNDPESLREKLVYKFVEHHCMVLEMKKIAMSLEDIFIELTENEKQDNVTEEEKK